MVTHETGAVKITEKIAAFDMHPFWLKSGKKDASHTVTLMLDVIFILMYSCLGLWELWDLARSLCCKCRGRAYASIWRVVDWINVAMGVALTLMYSYSNNLTEGLLGLAQVLPSLDVSKT